jgi:hypothetical protein
MSTTIHRLLVLFLIVASVQVATSRPTVASDPDSWTSKSDALEKTEAKDYFRCGYVRLNEDDEYMVGVYTRTKCEPIWKEEPASVFRIDASGCSCKFFTLVVIQTIVRPVLKVDRSMESCLQTNDSPIFTGPNFAEQTFNGDKPKFVYCQKQ